MKKLILMSIMLFGLIVCGSANAGTITTDDLGAFNSLSETQKAAIVASIAQKSESNGVAITSTPEKMKEWAEVGTAIGQGIAATAAELGIALDKFAESSIGKLAIGLLIYKVAGQEIIGVLFGLSWLLIGIPVWIYFFKRLVMKRTITYTDVEGEKKPQKVISYNTSSATDAEWVVTTITGCVVIAIGIFSIF